MTSYIIFQLIISVLFSETYYHLRPSSSQEQETESCYSCHTSVVIDKKDFLPVILERDSVHYKNGKYCTDCHKTESVYLKKRANSTREQILSACPFYNAHRKDRNGINELCGTCHREEYEDLLSGVHRNRLDCIYCHSNHGIKKASLDIIRPEKCSPCHRYPDIAPLRDEFKKAETVLLSSESFLRDKKEKMPNLYNTFTIKISAARSMMKSQHHRLLRSDITSNTHHILLLSGHIRKEITAEAERMRIRYIIKLSIYLIIVLAIVGVLYYLYQYIEWRRTLNKR